MPEPVHLAHDLFAEGGQAAVFRPGLAAESAQGVWLLWVSVM